MQTTHKMPKPENLVKIEEHVNTCWGLPVFGRDLSKRRPLNCTSFIVSQFLLLYSDQGFLSLLLAIVVVSTL